MGSLAWLEYIISFCASGLKFMQPPDNLRLISRWKICISTPQLLEVESYFITFVMMISKQTISLIQRCSLIRLYTSILCVMKMGSCTAYYTSYTNSRRSVTWERSTSSFLLFLTKGVSATRCFVLDQKILFLAEVIEFWSLENTGNWFLKNGHF